MSPETIIWMSFFFLVGLCVGSFLNVVIYRLPLEKSVVSPRSQCPSCGYGIPWYNNIPILSFLLLRGKCGNCKAPISWRYPLVELLTGILFAAVVWRQSDLFFQWPAHFFLMSALVASTFIDLDHWIIPDKITYPGVVIGLLSSLAPGPLSILQSVIGLLFGFGILYFVAWIYLTFAKKDGIGGGDIKFLAMVGAFFGIPGAIITLTLSSIVGSIVGIFLILFLGKKGKTAIPFGPFLAAGTLCTFLFGAELWQWYFQFH